MIVTRRCVGSDALAPCANCSTMSSGAKRWNDCSMCSRRSTERASAVRCRPTSAAQPPHVDRQRRERRDRRRRARWRARRVIPGASSAARSCWRARRRPTASTSTFGPSASSSGRVRAWMRAGCSGIQTVSRAHGISSASISVRRGEASVSSTSPSSRRENPSHVEQLGGARLADLALQRVGDDGEDQAQRPPRQHVGRERAVRACASSAAAAGDPSSARTTLPNGPSKVGRRVVGRRELEHRPACPAARPTACSRCPFISLASASISSSGGTASSVETRLQKPTTATTQRQLRGLRAR